MFSYDILLGEDFGGVDIQHKKYSLPPSSAKKGLHNFQLPKINNKITPDIQDNIEEIITLCFHLDSPGDAELVMQGFHIPFQTKEELLWRETKAKKTLSDKVSNKSIDLTIR